VDGEPLHAAVNSRPASAVQDETDGLDLSDLSKEKERKKERKKETFRSSVLIWSRSCTG